MAARNRERPGSDVLAGRPSIIEQNKQNELSSHLDCCLPQPSRHAVNALARSWRCCSEMRSARTRLFTIRRAISTRQIMQGSLVDLRPQTEQ